MDVGEVTTLERLYMGSVPATFVEAAGRSRAYHPGSTFREGDPADPDLRQLSLARLAPASFLGADHADLILPAIPAVDMVPVDPQHDDDDDDGGIVSLLWFSRTVSTLWVVDMMEGS